MTGIDQLIERLSSRQNWIKIESRRALMESKETQRHDLYSACKEMIPVGERLAVFKALSQIIRERFPDRICHPGPSWLDDMLNVIDFNNHADTQHDDIVAVLNGLKAAAT